MLKDRLLSLLIAMFLSGQAFSQDSIEQKPKWKFKENVSLNGYVKYMPSVSFTNVDNLLTNNLFHNRINLKIYLGEYFTVKSSLRNRVIYGEQIKFTPNYSQLIAADNGVMNLSKLWVDESSIIVHSIIDRAFVDFSKGKWQVRLGRQRVNWGINLTWNSNDLFNAYNIINFDYEERAGADALRVQYYMKNAEIDFAYQAGKDLDHSIIGMLYKFNKWKYDFQLLAANYKQDVAMGLGWAGNIKKAGFKGEGTFFQDKDSSANVVSISTSFDYFFKKGLYLNISGLYTSNGVSSFSPEAIGFATSLLSAKSLMPTKYSNLVQLSKEFNPRFKGSFMAIYGYGMNLSVLMPSASYSIQDNWDIDLTGQLFFASINGKYTNLSNSLFLRMRFSY